MKAIGKNVLSLLGFVCAIGAVFAFSPVKTESGAQQAYYFDTVLGQTMLASITTPDDTAVNPCSVSQTAIKCFVGDAQAFKDPQRNQELGRNF